MRAAPLLLWVLAGGVAAGGRDALAARAAADTPAAAGPSRVAAVHTESAVTVDGRLDELAWERAGVIPDLTQHAPHPGAPTPYRTEIRLLVDRDNLYIGIRCFDPEPAKISLHSMQRDIEDPFGDDFVTLVFDTFGDKRTGYLFEVHATGSVSDGLIPGPGILTTDWDGIWDARTSIDAQGWTVEMRIPSRTLHFKRGLSEWGFNVLRWVARDRLNFHWSGVTIDSDVIDLSSAGLLSGIAGLDQGKGLTVAPYALGRYERAPAEQTERTIGRGGLDLTCSPTPGLTGVLTANTDFAETEVDTRQINLTRFDLFFPEKRPFFLDGSSLFNFGLGLEQDFVPFYSRRMGLVELPTEFETVPIDWGGGRSARTAIPGGCPPTRWRASTPSGTARRSRATRSCRSAAGRRARAATFPAETGAAGASRWTFRTISGRPTRVSWSSATLSIPRSDSCLVRGRAGTISGTP